LQDAAYCALVNLPSDYPQSQGRQLRLVPDMQVNAEICLDTRTVVEDLLSLVQKAAHEARRER
jgi:HlyD family secretion protein